MNFRKFISNEDKLFNYSQTGFHDFLVDELNNFYNQCVARKSPRLMINLPPRHSMSTLLSRLYPAYALKVNKDFRLIHVSYNANIAEYHGMMVERVSAFGLERKYSNYYERVFGKGSARFCGIGEALCGYGADMVIIDSPYRNVDEAMCDETNQKIIRYYQQTLYPRLNPGAGIVVASNRWRSNDLCGELMQSKQETWRVISLPAIAGPNDQLGRLPGQALWPEKYPVHYLKRIADKLDVKWWQAIFQQAPFAEG